MTQFNDKQLQCFDCGNTFIFTAGEQEFFAKKGFTNEPKRCQDCKAKKKAHTKENDPGVEMTARRSKFRAQNGAIQKYPAVCSRCGKDFDAPFQPIEGRAVFCRECYVPKQK